MQAEELQHEEEQEEWPWQTWNDEVLQVLQEAHSSQRDQVRERQNEEA